MTYALLLAALVATPDAPPVLYLPAAAERPDDAQIDRVAAAWRDAGLAVRTQVTTPHGGRADLVAGGYAWEVELASHWHECVTQACFYAAELHLGAGVVLVVAPGEERLAERAEIACRRAGVLLLTVAPGGPVPSPPDADASPRLVLPAAKAGGADTELVAIGAEWCGPCRELHRANAGMPGVRWLDYDADSAEVRRLWAAAKPTSKAADGRPNALPAFVTLVGGKPAGHFTVRPHQTVDRAKLEWLLSRPKGTDP